MSQRSADAGFNEPSGYRRRSGKRRMIFESEPWKQDLVRDADILERWGAKSASAKRSFLLEKKVFTAAYIMRKLWESGKLSSSASGLSIVCVSFKCTRRMTWLDRWSYWDHYDLDNPTKVSVSLIDLINSVIHSYVFLEACDGGSTSFVVTSDRSRNKHLWQFSLSSYTDLMRRLGADFPSTSIMAFDDAAHEWVRWSGDGEPPPHVKASLASKRITLQGPHDRDFIPPSSEHRPRRTRR
jgi:hypothetical protein